MNAIVEQPAAPPPSNIMTPMTLLQMAVQQGADLDRLERLFALKREYEADEARKASNAAFAAFKDEAVRIIKNRTVKDGPLKGKSFAELYAVVNAVTPALSKHGLSVSWSVVADEKDWIKVRCTLKHVAGYSEFVEQGGPPDTGGAKNAIQARASTVTYLERYTLKAILGLAEQDDDDDGDGGAQTRDEQQRKRDEPPAAYDQAKFDANLPQWVGLIESGKKSPDELVAFIESRGAPLSDEQKKALRAVAKK
jgi:hypothetical protein